MNELKNSVCPLDCPDTCSLTVTVSGDRVVAVRGSKVNPITHGAVCAKVANYYPEFVHGPNRLRHPLKRVGAKGAAKFERISWVEALDTIHERVSTIIERYGPQALLPLNYAGPHGMLAADSMSLRFFHRIGASLLSRNPLCGGIRGAAYAGTFGATPGTPLQQVSLAKLVIVWGNNATSCNLHLMRQINAAKRNGARLVVIDPRRVKVAEQAHLHLSVRPGTDVVLAWAIAVELERIGGLDRAFIDAQVLGFDAYMGAARAYPPERAAEICGVPVDDIRTLARWYHEATPAVIAWGNGLERNQNGGSGLRAIAALPAIAGKFGIAGGGLVGGAGHAFPKTPDRLTRTDFVPPRTRTINIIDVGKLLLDESLDPPLKALFVYNHNPVIVHPDQNRLKQGLAREDLFVVGIEVAMTDSMAYADVVLPACTHFEHADLYAAYGQQYLQRAAPVIPPVGESLPNTEIFRRLAATFGFDDAAFGASDADLMDDALNLDDPRMQGIRASRVPLDRAIRMEFSGEEPVLFRNVSPRTPSGKVELESATLGARYGAALPAYRPLVSSYPLTLITPASDKRITSTFGGLAVGDSPPVLEMNPADAAARGLVDGSAVKVWNELGQVFLPLHVTAAIRPGVVSSEKGAWLRTSPNGQTVSALAPTHKADLAEGACYNDSRVEVAAQ
ncbi:MAG: oxidoreductase, molybdopterin-binding protein [Gammaproteobacteria bacterium]|nr:oxidoreductase, molybdopterin-binding protein [Gammaproteobacteria bacterium]